MGMSRPFADAGECFERFAEAEKAQENGFFYGKGRLFLVLEETPPEHEAFSQLNRLLKTEGKGALASVREQLPGLMACVRESGLSASRCGEVYRDVYSHVKGLIRVTCQDWEDPLLDRLHRFSSFEGFQDVQEYAEAFAGFLEEAERELSLRRSAGGESVIRSIRLYVEQHLEEKITLETVSRSVYLSPSYVCRIFKRETGENLQDYIMDKKLERAAVLLREKKVGEVSDQLAFSSHSYFIKLFKDCLLYTSTWRTAAPLRRTAISSIRMFCRACLTPMWSRTATPRIITAARSGLRRLQSAAGSGLSCLRRRPPCAVCWRSSAASALTCAPLTWRAIAAR